MAALTGSRVLDLTVTPIGASCARLLAELGADVLRADLAVSALSERAAFRHAGKRLTTLSANELIARESANADLIVVDTHEIAAVADHSPAPTLRLLVQSGGAMLGDEPVPDAALAAIGGLTFVTGDPAESPTTPAHMVATQLVALYAACVAAATLASTRPSKRLDVFAQDSVAACLESTLPIYFFEHRSLSRELNMHDIAWPVSSYRTADGWVGITCGRVEESYRMLAALGMPPLLPTGLATFSEIGDIGQIDSAFERLINQMSSTDVVERCQSVRIAAAPAITPIEVAHDAQALARNFISEWPGGRKALRLPIELHGQVRSAATPPIDSGDLLVPARTERGRRDSQSSGLPPLHGVRVLDLTWALAGPYATMVLADLGADVAKLESPAFVDSSRISGPFLGGVIDVESSGYFRFHNRNKRSVDCDLGTSAGRDLVRSLATTADIAMENFRPRSLDEKQLGYENLRAVNPRLVMCSVSGFGRNGPHSGWASYGGAMAECANGLAMATGDSRPIVPGRAIADILAGLYSALAVVAQLYAQRRDGEGSYSEVTQFEAGAAGIQELVTMGPDPDDPYRVSGSDQEGWHVQTALGLWPVLDARAVAERLEVQGSLEHHDTPEGKDHFVRLPAAFDGTRTAICRISPRLGEHTNAVVSEWECN